MFKKPMFAILGLFSIINCKSYAADKDTIKFRADSWCPYNCNPKDKDPGYMVEVLQAAFGKEHVNYETMNWARAILDSREGKFDGIIGAAKEDAPDFIFSAPLGVSKNCFYAKKTSKFKYTNIESLKSVKLGVVKDYAYFDDLNAYIKKHYSDRDKVDEHFGDEVQDKMIQKLEKNKLGAFVGDPNVISYVLKKHPKITDIVEVGCSENVDLYIAFPPGNPKSKERAAKVSETIEKLKADGGMTKILAKYALKPL